MAYRYFDKDGTRMIEIEVDATNKIVREATKQDAKDFPEKEAGVEEKKQQAEVAKQQKEELDRQNAKQPITHAVASESAPQARPVEAVDDAHHERRPARALHDEDKRK